MRYFLLRLFAVVLLLAFLSTEFAYASLLPSPEGETPGSLACIYGLTPSVPGCTIRGALTVPTGGSGAIAIIDGQDDPDAAIELSTFSSQFAGLTVLQTCNGSNAPCFQQYYTNQPNNQPFDPVNPCVPAANNASAYGIKQTTDIEPALDIEWAHAMAPNASIYMVETQGWGDDTNPNNPNITGLIQGIQCAVYLLQTNNGGGIISYSHSFQEWAGETAYDSYFQIPGIIFVASSGDYSAPARYPATSPYVIAAGGTSINRDASGKYINQVAWNNGIGKDCDPVCKTGGTGGPSIYESRPAYQNSVQKIVGTQRGTPDISFAAAGIDVFCCQLTSVGPPPTTNKCCGPGTNTKCESFPQCSANQGAWVTTGGTSLASPALAGIINSAHSGATSTTQELSIIYNGAIKNYNQYWTDIISGNNGYPALRGYDFATGIGVPRGYGGK